MGKGTMIRKYLLMRGPEEALRLISRLLGSDGGPGSGNFGHKGRPGEVGGSGGGGGSAFRTSSGSGAYIGVQKAAAWNGIKKVAQKSKDAREFLDGLDKTQRDMIVQQHRQSGTKERIMDYTERLRQLMTSQKPNKMVPQKIVEGKEAVESCVWDGKQYTEPTYGQVIDTEIEHVIVQQGFNGPPKVVSQQELMDIIDQHPEMPVLFRSYAALGEEAVQAYDDMLESGEWYIDCSNGGAQYGQGMYCAGVYGSQDYSGALDEMSHYRHVSMKNCQARWYPTLAEGEDCIGVDGKQYVYRPDKFHEPDKEKPPEVTDVVAMIRTPTSVLTTKGYFMPADPEDDDSPLEFYYYVDGIGTLSAKAEDIPYWFDIDRVETPPAAKASTRMMTLDPSSKIISYKDAQQLFDGKMTKDQRKKIYREKVDDLEKKLATEDLSDDERFLVAYTSKIGLDLVTPEDQQKYVDVCTRVDDSRRKELMDRGEQYGHGFFQEVRDLDKEQAERTKEIRARYNNIGSYMAALGYDAINAEGHGSTNSYTVVLNRTKLIVSQSRIDVAA